VRPALLWRVDRNGAISHLFGTLHAGRSHTDALGPSGLAALDRARTVVVELDLDAPDTTSSLAALVAERGRLPADRSLDRMVTPRTWTWLTEQLGDRFPAVALRGMQPWLAMYVVIGARASIALQPSNEAGDAPPPVPMDRDIARHAKTRGQRLVALETAADQIRLLADTPETLATAFLEEAARDPDALDRQLRGVVGGASGADPIRAVEDMIDQYARESPAMAEAMFFARNRAWLPRLRPLLDAGGAFVAVGAGHLVGDLGLVAMLEAAGYRIAPVGTLPTPQSRAASRRGTVTNARSVETTTRPATASGSRSNRCASK